MITHEETRTVIPTTDKRLDWVSHHDPLSLNFRFGSGPLETVPDVAKQWALGATLDQGQEGACVGFGWTGELLASPKGAPSVREMLANTYALNYYARAKEIDEYPGVDYTGTSVLAGAKVAKERGLIGGYRWCFNIEDVRKAVITEGPVVIGIPWYEAMYEPDDSLVLRVDGKVAGGHCLLVYGYNPAVRIKGVTGHQRVFRLRNSWGPDWGLRGNAFITYDDLARLLDDAGEACVPMDRRPIRGKITLPKTAAPRHRKDS